MPFASAKTSLLRFIGRHRFWPFFGAAVVVLLGTGFFLLRNFLGESKTPAPEALQSSVAAQFGARYGRLFTVAAFQPGQAAGGPAPASGHLRFNANVTARLSESLYVLVNSTEFIAREMKLDTSAGQKIARIVSGPGGARIRELAGIGATSDSLASMQLVRETARAGERFEFQALIDAVRIDGDWKISVVSLMPRAPLPAGETLDKFSGRLLDVTRESDLATLRRMVAQGDETLRRVEQARDRYRAEAGARAERVINAALAQLAPGALFTGDAVFRATNATAVRICLEIISVNRAMQAVTARLRADGSWLDARPLTGRFRYDNESESFLLVLAAREGVPLGGDSGETLENGRAFELVFQLGDAGFSGGADAWACRLARVPDSARAEAIARFSAREQALLDATRGGTVFRVRTAAALEPGDAAPDLILRVDSQNAQTGALTGSLENMHGIWSRVVRGGVVANPARSGGFPLRFESAPQLSLQLRPGRDGVFNGSIHLEGVRPVDVFLEPADSEYLAKLPALAGARDERRREAVDAAAKLAALREAMAREGPFHASRIPAANGAYALDGETWKSLPTNGAKVVKSAFQKIGGVWTSALGLLKTQPERQDVGTLTFEGAGAPPAVGGRGVVLMFRGRFNVYDGAPPGKPPMEVVVLEIKNRGRKRVAELERLGEAAATFGGRAAAVLVERHATVPDVFIVRVQPALAAGRYAFRASDLFFEFEVRK